MTRQGCLDSINELLSVQLNELSSVQTNQQNYVIVNFVSQ